MVGRRPNGRLGTSDFITDPDTESESDVEFYPNLISRAKQDAGLRYGVSSSTGDVAALKTPARSSPHPASGSSLSFLGSLSETTSELPCHPDAATFKEDYKHKKEELTRKLFNIYNKEVFEHKLPADMVIEWNSRMTSTSGFCYNKRVYSSDNQVSRKSRIVLSTKILDRADRLRDTLIHELCHAATWIINGFSNGHRLHWKNWANKANRRFPDLPRIKICYNCKISTTYTYRCRQCGYCIGEHSKSLDVLRKRCGYCYRKLQLSVTAKMSQMSDEAESWSGSDMAPAQAKHPTGFALFVKQNYARVKKQNPPHAQVMKLLCQKFTEAKITRQNPVCIPSQNDNSIYKLIDIL